LVVVSVAAFIGHVDLAVEEFQCLNGRQKCAQSIHMMLVDFAIFKGNRFRLTQQCCERPWIDEEIKLIITIPEFEVLVFDVSITELFANLFFGLGAIQHAHNIPHDIR
jgi:hypothetical protein